MVTKTKLIIFGGKRRLFSFLLLEYDFYLLNRIRVEFTPQIQINKEIVKTVYDSINHTRIPKEVLPDCACPGISGTKGDSVQYCLLSKGTYQHPVQ